MSGQPPYLTAAQYPYSRDIRYASCSNPDSTIGYNRRPSMLGNYHQYSSTDRVSMHPYYLQMPPEAMGPHIDENSKHHRFPTMNSHLNSMSHDVKTEQPLYQPTTEAISPIHDDVKFDTHLRDTTIIRSSISKLDSDIELTLKKLQRAQLSQNEIRRQADTTAVEDEETQDITQVNESQTLIEKILHDNRKRAEDDQRVRNQFNNNMDLSIPLYQEPNDLELIGMIRRKYMNIMKNHLLHLFKKSRDRYLSRTKFASDRYDEAYQRWQQSIEKEEKTILAKDTSTYREIFERTFSELRKAREDKEKKQTNQTANDNGSTSSSSSSTSSIDSSSVQQPSLSNNINHEQEMEEDEEKMRKSSVVPPIIFDCWQRKHQFFNENGLVKDDPHLFYKEEAKLPYWTPDERQIFIEKFTQLPKNFGYISSFLANKTTEQCVQFYYMTKKGENYKSLLRKQAQNTRRRTKHNTTTTLTTTTVTSSTTIETTLVTKVSSNTIFSSTSQKILGSTNGTGQDIERPSERIENDEERRDHNLNDGNEEKRANKKCSFLSCTAGRKKNRKSRLRAFPSQWNELTDENREEIRRNLQIPPNVQRCCIRCYEKLIEQVCQRQTNEALEDDDDNDDDDGDDEENNEPTVSSQPSSKLEKDEWANADIDAFRKTVEKYNFNWREIANHFQRSEQSCRTFYRLNQQVSYPDDAADDDNGSVSDSEQLVTMKPKMNDERSKLNINEDSNDSIHPMIIDEGEDDRSVHEDSTTKVTQPLPIVSNSNLTTINSLVEKEISKTLHETEKRSVPDSAHSEPSISTEKSTSCRPSQNSTIPTVTGAPPPALVIPVRPHSPTNTHYTHPSQTSASSAKGSIMRGTPILSSVGPHKPIPIDPLTNQPHQHSSSRPETSNLKSPKMLDRNLEQHNLHSQQQQQQQHNAYMRQHAPQSHVPTMYPQSHKSSSNKIDMGNPNRLERLRADYVTSKYLTNPATTHSSGHERSHRSNIHESRGSRQGSPPLNQHLHQPSSNPSIHPSMHSHHGLNTGNFLSPTQLFATSGMYPHDSLPNPALSYSPYYGPLLPGTSVLFNPHVMQDYASVTAANNEQYKARSMRTHHPHHSPADPTTYSSHLPNRHPHDEMGYANPDYMTSPWRTTNMNNNNLNKTTHGSNENPMLKLVDASRHSSMRLPTSNDMDRRSPDDSHSAHHRLQLSRSTVDMPSVHFPRAEVHNHHKPPHDKVNAHSHYLDHSNDPNALAYMRESVHIAKPQPKHHSSHRLPLTATAPSRPIMSSSSSSMPGSQQGGYMMHGFHHPTALGTVSPHRQHQQASGHHPHPQHHYSPASRTSHPYESTKNSKDFMSIQEYMSKTVDDFVRSSNHDPKHQHTDQHLNESSTNSSSNRNHQANNCDQPILIDGDEDLNTTEQSEAEGNSRNLNKSNTEMEMFGRRRVSSIKKILSNQALDKHQYDDITQQMQNSTNNSNTSKASANTDQSGIERSNSIGGRTRSRGSITMRMLMGEHEAYADGKAQSKTSPEETSNKRSLSSDSNCEKIEYLIRDELIRSRPTMNKGSESPSVFSRPPSNQQFMPSSKRMKTSTRDDEQRTSSNHSTRDSPGPSRDPFVLQSQSKSSHPSFQSSANIERHWQSLAQQQYHSSPSLNSRPSRPTGSITQGSPISSSIRLSTDQSSYSLAANNQLINPRYSHYMNKNDQSYSVSRQSSTSPHEHSSRQKIPRRSHQTTLPSSESVQQPYTPVLVESSSTAKSPSRIPTINNTPPTTAISGHSLKKRLITEYELEQQRNSPIPIVTSTPNRTDAVEETITRSAETNNQKCEVHVESRSDLREEDAAESVNDSVALT